MKRKKYIAADLFCGAGGASNGLAAACREAGRDLDLTAVNHWPVAVETHSRNHPAAKHLCEDLGSCNPRKAVPGGRLDLLLAGPECTHHSLARGGKPVNDQSRASAWCILRWATALTIDTILIENVREFMQWGPIGASGKPLASKKGETFAAFIAALKSLGYRVDYRLFNAADYGDPTTRVRLFIQARRGKRPVCWPDATHSPHGEPSLYSRMERWRSAREIIDWSILAPSIFGRKKPLSPNTLARIAAGLRKFGGKAAEPFIVLLNGGGRAGAGGSQSLDRPVPTVTAGGNHFGLCEPFVLSAGGPNVDARLVSRPLNTVLTRDHMALCEPFILPPEGVHRGNAPRSLDDPLQTITSRGGGQLVEPFLMGMSQSGSNGDRTRSLGRPAPTITTADDVALVEPFVIPLTHGGGADRCNDLGLPLPTLTASRELALIQPFLTKYNGTALAQPVDEPLDTVTGRDRFGLASPVEGEAGIDIRFRMLQPSELAAAHSFPPGYLFSGNREDQVKQVGNSWPNRLSKALCAAVIN